MNARIKILCLFAILFALTSTGYSQEGSFDKTLTDITIESTNRFIENNVTTSFTSTQGLEFVFTGKEYFEDMDKEYDLYGLIQYDEERISINVEQIYNDSQDLNYTDDQLYAKIQNTLMHEIGHYIDHYDRIPDFREIHNVTEVNEVLQDKQYFIDIYENDVQNAFGNESVPYFLEPTLDFGQLYNGEWGYSSDKYAEETLARIFAVCWLEKEDYNYYWEMFEVKDERAICQNFDYPSYFDNRLNEIGEEIITGYIETYDTAYENEKDFFDISMLVTNFYGFTGLFVEGVTNLLINNVLEMILIISIISLIIVLLDIIVYYILDEHILNLYKRNSR